MIRLDNVSKTYRRGLKRVTALQGLSTTVSKGETVALVGPNGAGKTTVLKVVCGLTNPTSGSVIVERSPSNAYGRNRPLIGYAAQSPALDIYATVSQNLRLQGSLLRRRRMDLHDDLESLIARFQLAPHVHTEARHLSGGIRRRLDVAMAVMGMPHVLVLDEPTAGLDPDGRKILWECLAQIQHTIGITTLFSTHYLNEAEEYASRIIFVDKGEVLTEGSPQFLLKEFGLGTLIIRFSSPKSAANAIGIGKNSKLGERARLSSEKIVIENVRDSSIGFWIEKLHMLKLPFVEYNYRKPSLDDVYLSVTGEDFRERHLIAQRDQIEAQKGIWR